MIYWQVIIIDRFKLHSSLANYNNYRNEEKIILRESNSTDAELIKQVEKLFIVDATREMHVDAPYDGSRSF